MALGKVCTIACMLSAGPGIPMGGLMKELLSLMVKLVGMMSTSSFPLGMFSFLILFMIVLMSDLVICLSAEPEIVDSCLE